MKRSKSKVSARAVLLLIVIALLFGFACELALTGIERLIYPERYKELVTKYANEYAVPSELVFAVIKTESNFKPDAVSSAGAVGLMQLLPSTYEWLTTLTGERFVSDMLYDPETNIKYGTYYLQYLYSYFGSWEKVLIAYNWGPGNLIGYLEENEYASGDYKKLPVAETRNYVSKVLYGMEVYKKFSK